MVTVVSCKYVSFIYFIMSLFFSCLLLQVNTTKPDELVYIFTDFNSKVHYLEGRRYTVECCSGIAIDLLNSVASDLNFDYNLYLVADGLFGVPRNGGQWDGITADLVSGAAHIAFSAFSVTSGRVNVSFDYRTIIGRQLEKDNIFKLLQKST